GNKEIYRVHLKQGTEAKIAESEHDFFEALQRLRLQLEKDGALLHCFGASENVYPSGMQRSMRPAILAYRTKIGSPASREDIVNIFEARDRRSSHGQSAGNLSPEVDGEPAQAVMAA